VSNDNTGINSPGEDRENLLEVFNKHFDEYLERYGVATPKSRKDQEPASIEEVKAPTEVDDTVEEVLVASEATFDVEPETSFDHLVESSAADEEPVSTEENSFFQASDDFEEDEDAQVEPVTVEDDDEDEFYYPESASAELDDEDDLVQHAETDGLIDDDEEDDFYDPEEASTEADELVEAPVEEVHAEPAAPVREVVREILVVDRDQARELGYSADNYVETEARPAPKPAPIQAPEISRSVSFPPAETPKPAVTSTPRPDFDKKVDLPSRKEPIRSESREEKRSFLGGLFGRKEEPTPVRSESRYETSRLRTEEPSSETGFVTGPENNAPISLKTQEGYDAREERLRLQHVNTEKRDVDPAVWLEETMLDALKLDASDLHIVIDGETRNLRARIRVDGQMRDFDYVEGVPARVIMGRLKAATELSSGGSFEPEETIYTLMLDGEKRKARAVLFRVEDGGEALVMRLPLTGNLKQLDELDFADYNLDLVYRLLAMPYKLIMIAGPMGSGKTTTAHGALLHVAKQTRTVWTIEDPVERRLPNLVQLEIDEDNGAGFDVLLSKLLRADYNTLFLGEIRDRATAAAAVRQAKAGRQVMSTIHADDNIFALLRLIELAGDSPLSVLSAVGGVISQRLIRRLNPDWDGVDLDTKYKGRVPIHEIMFINDAIIEVMMQDSPLSAIKQAASEAVGSAFAQDAHRLIAAGVTDREEIVTVIGEFE